MLIYVGNAVVDSFQVQAMCTTCYRRCDLTADLDVVEHYR